MRHLQGRPLRPVEGVVHERLGLVMTQHREVIHVMGASSAFDGAHSMGTGVHPAAMMRLHF